MCQVSGYNSTLFVNVCAFSRSVVNINHAIYGKIIKKVTKRLAGNSCITEAVQ